VRFVEAMPRNTSGKMQHFKLRQMIESEAPEGPA
jgi:2-aminobenzoate-CoA ligase